MKENQTKTVCFFNSNKAWGGGEKWHFQTCKELERRGYRTLLVTHNHSQLRVKATQDRMNVFSFSVGNLSFLNPLKILVMAAFFKSKGVDAIVLNLPADLKLAGLAAKLAGVRKIIYRRGMPHPLRNTWLNRFLFTKVLTDIVVNSEEIGRNLEKGNEAWYPKEKMTLIYNGVDLTKPVDRSRKLYEKKDGEIVIGNAGRLTEQKGQKYLIEMAEILKREGVKFVVLIAGQGDLRDLLLASINAKGLQNEVRLLGHVDDMPAFMSSLDVFVFPSLFEGTANTLIETLLFELPTIAFDVSSNGEIIEDGKNGFLVKLGDSKAMADVILSGTYKTASEFEKPLKEKFDYRKNINKLGSIIEPNLIT